MTGEINATAGAHLLRRDGQEDICFALWFPSTGRSRNTALVERLLLPLAGERNVHGNVSFNPAFLERALAEATACGAGVALLHSHPNGRRWQGVSHDDVTTEMRIAGSVFGATSLPLVGLTLAGDGAWSSRFWQRTVPRSYTRFDCATVRVISDGLQVSFYDNLARPPGSNGRQIRTVAAWGQEAQNDLAHLRVGIIGAGSVGGMVGEALARIGFEDVMVIDFDRVEEHNLDRLVYATRADIGRLKIEVMAEHLSARATADSCQIELVLGAVYEEEAFRAALDCDVLFSCVDRPWGRYILNLIAYAHLIPVFDGGISVRMNRLGKISAADWKALTAAPGRQCLQCAGQYDPGLVQMEREGFLDDPVYIQGLPNNHPLKSRENVFAFSMGCGNMQLLQMLAMALAPLDQPNPGTQLYHFVGNAMEQPTFGQCHAECQFPGIIAMEISAAYARWRQSLRTFRAAGAFGVALTPAPPSRYQEPRALPAEIWSPARYAKRAGSHPGLGQGH
jgi:hypothetical protein